MKKNHSLFILTVGLLTTVQAVEEKPRLDTELEVDLICWQAKQNGNIFVTSGALKDTTFSAFDSGGVYEPKLEMDPGFRLGFAKILDYDDWKLSANYTYFTNKSSKSLNSDNIPSGLIPTLVYAPSGSSIAEVLTTTSTIVSSASADWKLNFNNINLELGKNFRPSSKIKFYPYFGLQTVFSEQKLHLNYLSKQLSTTLIPYGQNISRYKQNSWGLGPRIGFESNWNFSNCLSFYIGSALSTLWSYFDSSIKNYDTIYTAYTEKELANQKYKTHSITPVIEGLIGLQGDWQNNKKTKNFSILTGWEQQVWFYQNQHASTIADNSLLLQGLTVRFRADF